MLCKISVDPLCRIICQSSRRLSENDEFHKSCNFPGFRAFPVLLRCPLFIGDLKLRQFFFVFLSCCAISTCFTAVRIPKLPLPSSPLPSYLLPLPEGSVRSPFSQTTYSPPAGSAHLPGSSYWDPPWQISRWDGPLPLRISGFSVGSEHFLILQRNRLSVHGQFPNLTDAGTHCRIQPQIMYVTVEFHGKLCLFSAT